MFGVCLLQTKLNKVIKVNMLDTCFINSDNNSWSMITKTQPQNFMTINQSFKNRKFMKCNKILSNVLQNKHLM